ncbi:MAG: hypothetical protein GH158_05555 [Dehalococcoidia bacterium]|nr:hypothetical protein [Dehalococcoidia bacterium]
MTTEEQKQGELDRLPESHYNAAVQLHNQEFRTLGERTTAFLIIQSILIAGFFTVLVNPTWFPSAFPFIILGISIAGVLFCISHHISGKTGSQAAFKWKQYMLYIENKRQDAPWNWVYNCCSDNHEKHGEPRKRNLFRRLLCRRCLLERSPLPSSWITTPAIFLMVWFCASLYVVVRLLLPNDHLHSNSLICPSVSISISFIIMLFALGALSFVIWQASVWWQNR